MSSSLDKFKTLKITICVPSHGQWHAWFGRDLQQLVSALNHFRIGNYKDQEVSMCYVRGSILTKSRLEGLREAKRLGADYLLYIDTDQTFPRKLVHKLISRNVSVIGINVATKTIPAAPTARLKGATLKDWTPVYTDEHSTGIQRVDRVGTGILMLRKDAFERLPYSCFNMIYREDIDDVQGEDWSLCEALEKLGIPIYVDHELSNEVGHVGDFIYTHEVVGQIVKREQEHVGDPEPRPAAQAA